VSRGGLCALCVRESDLLVPIKLDGSRYWICKACDEEHPRYGRYSFGGGRSSAVDEPMNRTTPGTRRVSNKGNGRG
jgi:hypothetical protein